MRLGFVRGVSNEDYHKGPGISRSQLKYFQEHPSTFKWAQNAPEDDSKSGTLDFGTLTHWRFLEHETDPRRYSVMPKFGRSKEELEKKANWLEAMEASGAFICTEDERHKVEVMYRSALAHPMARELIEAKGDAEMSIYWKCPVTGNLLKCRPDKVVIIDGVAYIVDVKTSDSIEKFLADRWGGSFYDYGYHQQAAFYIDGYRAAWAITNPGEPCPPVRFVFIVIQTTVSCRKYPVGTFLMPADLIREGREQYNQTLVALDYCQKNNDWGGLRVLAKPEKWKKSK